MRNKTLVVFALLLGALGLACSAKSNTSQPSAARPANAAVIKASALTSQGAGTVTFNVTLSAKGTPLGDQTVTGKGAADLSAQRASFDGQVLGSPLSAVIDSQTVYAQSSLLGQGWYKADASSMKSGSIPQPLANALTNPSQAFDLLKSVSGNVQSLGAETINGGQTTHYQASVDPAKVATVFGDTGHVPAGAASVPVDVWVDNNNLIQRLSLAYTGAGSNSAASQISLTIDVTGYGQAVNIAVPPAADVKDISQSNLGMFLGGLKGGHTP